MRFPFGACVRWSTLDRSGRPCKPITSSEAIAITGRVAAGPAWRETGVVGVLVGPTAAWDDPDILSPVVIVGARAALGQGGARVLLDAAAGEAQGIWGGAAWLANTVHRLLREGWTWAWEAPLDSPAFGEWHAGNLAWVGASRLQTPGA